MCVAFTLSIKLFLSKSNKFSHFSLSILSPIPLGWAGGKWMSGFVGLCCQLGLSCDIMLPNICLNRFSIEINHNIEQIIMPPWFSEGLCCVPRSNLTWHVWRSSSTFSSDKFSSLLCHWLSSIQIALLQVFKYEMVMTICVVHILYSQSSINVNKNAVIWVHMKRGCFNILRDHK